MKSILKLLNRTLDHLLPAFLGFLVFLSILVLIADLWYWRP